MMQKPHTTLFFFSFLCLGIILAASAGIAVQHPNQLRSKPTTDPYLTMTITLYQGTGCDCNPIPGVPVNATGRDTDHNDSNVTNDRGVCDLHLQYGKTYRISVNASHFESVLLDIQTIDNQNLTFHLKPLKGDISTVSGLPAILATLFHALQKVRHIPS